MGRMQGTCLGAGPLSHKSDVAFDLGAQVWSPQIAEPHVPVAADQRLP